MTLIRCSALNLTDAIIHAWIQMTNLQYLTVYVYSWCLQGVRIVRVPLDLFWKQTAQNMSNYWKASIKMGYLQGFQYFFGSKSTKTPMARWLPQSDRHHHMDQLLTKGLQWQKWLVIKQCRKNYPVFNVSPP